MILNLKRKISKRSLILYFVCLYGLNIFLLLLALVQAIVSGYLITGKDIPIPKFVLKDLQENLADYGLYAETEKLNFDLLGRVTARRLKIFRERGGDLLGQFDSLQLALDIPLLLLKRVSVDSLVLQNGRLVCPAFYSYSGVSETVANKIHGRFTRHDNSWEVERFDFHFSGLRAHVSGTWPQAGFTLPGEPLVEPAFLPRPLERYLSFCRQVIEMQSKVRLVENPVARIVLSFNKGERPKAQLNLISDAFIFPRGWRGGAFRLEIPHIELPQLAFTRPIVGEVLDLDWENRIHATDLAVRIQSRSVPELMAGHVGLTLFKAAGIVAEGNAVEAFSGDLKLSFPRLAGSAQALIENHPIRLRGNIDIQQKSGFLSLDSEADLFKALRKYLAGLGNGAAVLDRLTLSVPPHLQVSSTFGPDFKFEAADFSLALGPLSFGGVDFLRFKARGRADLKFIRLTEYTLEKPGERVDGSLEIDLKEGEYRLLLAGQGNPILLNPIMPDWWDNIWKNISFGEVPLHADLEVRAGWRESGLKFYFGSYNGRDVIFKNAEFKVFDLKSWALPGFVEIYDLHAVRPEGSARGSVIWVFQDKAAVAQILDLRTHLDIAPLSTLLGPDVSAVVADFDLTEPPELHLTGNLYYPSAPWPIRRKIHLQAASDAPLSYLGYPMDYLHFQSDLTDNRFEMEQVGFGFAGGDGGGRLTWQKIESQNKLDVVLFLKDADQRKAFETLGWLQPPDSPTANGGKKSPRMQAGSGLLDMDFTATGVPGDLYSFKGVGKLQVTEADLGKVHLFGGLSRALYGTGLNFTTFKLDTAEGEFILNENLLQFPEVSVSGPGSLIRARGGIVMPEGGLDFKVRVHFFENGEKSILAILGPILKPFENALELRLRGTLKEPRWRFQINPVNVFSSPLNQQPLPNVEKKQESFDPPIDPPIPESDL